MRLTRYLLCVPAWLLLADAAIATQTLGVPAGIATVGTSALPIAGLSLLGVAVAGLAIGIRIVRRKRKE